MIMIAWLQKANSPKNWKLANFSESDNPAIIAKLIYTNRFQEFENYLIHD